MGLDGVAVDGSDQKLYDSLQKNDIVSLNSESVNIRMINSPLKKTDPNVVLERSMRRCDRRNIRSIDSNPLGCGESQGGELSRLCGMTVGGVASASVTTVISVVERESGGMNKTKLTDSLIKV